MRIHKTKVGRYYRDHLRAYQKKTWIWWRCSNYQLWKILCKRKEGKERLESFNRWTCHDCSKTSSDFQVFWQVEGKDKPLKINLIGLAIFRATVRNCTPNSKVLFWPWNTLDPSFYISNQPTTMFPENCAQIDAGDWKIVENYIPIYTMTGAVE